MKEGRFFIACIKLFMKPFVYIPKTAKASFL